MRPIPLPGILLAAALLGGCTGTVGYSASVSTQGYAPELVYAAPGVQVIADYDEPIFYADNYYWRFDGGTWYRSTVYSGGWAYASPPSVIVQIGQPQRYVHYRPQGWTPRRVEPAPRDHREPTPRAMRQPPPRVVAPPPRQQPPRVDVPPPRKPTRAPDQHDQRDGHGDQDRRDHDNRDHR
jgi:hypothetical protein